MRVPKGEKVAGVSGCTGTRRGLDGETVGRVEGIVVVLWEVMRSTGQNSMGAAVLVVDVDRFRSEIVFQCQYRIERCSSLAATISVMAPALGGQSSHNLGTSLRIGRLGLIDRASFVVRIPPDC